MNQEKQILPRFRKDLRLYRGPNDADGSPTYTLYDPLKGQYSKFTWKESLLFKMYRKGMTKEELAETITKNYPVELTAEDVEHFFLQAANLGLLQIPRDGDSIYQTRTQHTLSWWMWFIHNYLFLRVRLLNPDPFLQRTVKYVEPLGSLLALAIYLSVFLFGFLVLIGRFDEFKNTLTYFFNLEGFLLFALTISVVKIIHEFSHAYVAKHFGLYVPSMGLGLLVLWPVLFTDVTDGWKLVKKRERFLISFAGIGAESVIAGFATLGWAATSPGILHSIFFILASSSWFSTVMINANPAVRFDGYYILSDLWGVDNLMGTAFRVTRWKLHQWLFGLEQECPEENLSPRRTAGFIIYTFYTITYRIFLYTAIAFFVYYEFTKVVGTILFAAEIWIFFLWPVWWEMQLLYQLRSRLTLNPRSFITTTVFGLFAFWLIFPLPHQMDFDGVLVPEEKQTIYSAEVAQVKKIHVKRGDMVHWGDVLVEMSSRDLVKKMIEALYEKESLEKEILFHTLEKQQGKYLSEKKAKLAQTEEYYQTLEQRKKQLTVVSEMAGKVIDWDDKVKEGQYIPQGEILGAIAQENSVSVLAFVRETDIEKFYQGQKVLVIVPEPQLQFLSGTVQNIQQARSHALLYPSLASVYHGPLAVVPQERRKELELVESYFMVKIVLNSTDNEQTYFGQTVKIRIRGPWRSYLWELVQTFVRVLVRESSF